MAIENSDDLFEIEIGTFNNNEGEQLPNLCDRLMHGHESSPEGDQTD